MSDPTREELIEIGAKADWDGRHNREGVTTAILDAILPRVLEGVVEALEPFAKVPDWIRPTEPDESDAGNVVTFDLGDCRRARSVRQWAEKMRGA